VQRARASGETTLAAHIAIAATKDWHAALAILQRRWPERWNVVQRTELSGPGGGPIEVAPARERLDAKLAKLAARGSSGPPAATSSSDELDAATETEPAALAPPRASIPMRSDAGASGRSSAGT
jgi:hypothetical protein